MESEVAIHTSEGSPVAQSALAALADVLNINENALKTALNGAFDLLPTAAGNPMLALHVSFQRLSYHIDSKNSFEIMSAFRRAFGAALSVEGVNYATTQADRSRFHGAPPVFAPPRHSVYIAPPRYTASTFRSSNQPAGLYAISPVMGHQYAPVYSPSWNPDYTGNVTSALQSTDMSAEQSNSVSQRYWGPGMPSQGDGVPSFIPEESHYGEYQ